MKKVIILLTGLMILWGAQNSKQKDIYLEYTNKVINYEFDLKNLDKIKSPFYVVIKRSSSGKHIKKEVVVKKRIVLTLLSIFGNRAFIKTEEYLGEQLVKKQKKWIKLYDKIYNCILKKITSTDVYFKCANKTLHKTLNKKIPMLRDKQ
jgi:hypothetical protein